VRAALGALIAGGAMYAVSQVLWHGRPPAWPPIAASLSGAMIGAAGSRHSHLSVPLVTAALAVLGIIIVFDLHGERFDSRVFGALGVAVTGNRDLRSSDVKVGLEMTARSPSLTGCDRTLVSISYTVSPRHGSTGSLQRASMLVQHPRDATISLFESESRISRKLEGDFSRYTIIESPLQQTANNLSTTRVSFLIDQLTRPRTVGSCYVPLPALTAASVRSVPCRTNKSRSSSVLHRASWSCEPELERWSGRLRIRRRPGSNRRSRPGNAMRPRGPKQPE
jgi:hypothetical protein